MSTCAWANSGWGGVWSRKFPWGGLGLGGHEKPWKTLVLGSEGPGNIGAEKPGKPGTEKHGKPVSKHMEGACSNCKKDLHLLDIGVYMLSSKRGSSLPWCVTTHSQQDSVCCDPSLEAILDPSANQDSKGWWVGQSTECVPRLVQATHVCWSCRRYVHEDDQAGER